MLVADRSENSENTQKEKICKINIRWSRLRAGGAKLFVNDISYKTSCTPEITSLCRLQSTSHDNNKNTICIKGCGI